MPGTVALSQKRLGAQGIEPTVQAEAYALIDVASGEILAGKNLELSLFPASTTKLMSALVVVEDMDLESIASVSATFQRDGSNMSLVPGEHIKVKDLLAGMLIHSANDAASVLSQHYKGGTEEFVKAMNAKAARLSMWNSHFTNPMGYTDPQHFMSVRDLLILGRETMKNDEIRRLVKTKKMIVSSVDLQYTHSIETTNELLGKVEGLEGIKTGWTEESGECLVAQAKRGDQTLLSVVLKSPDRFKESSQLLEWGFANYVSKTIPITDL